jgi:AbiJ N-terminal domain 4
MMAPGESFSRRHGYRSGAKEITVRENAPESLRYFVLQTAIDLRWQPSSLRYLLCRVLRTRPDANNWSEYPNIWGEVEYLMYGCPWFRVYNIIEGIYSGCADREGIETARVFAEHVNEFFIEEGIGWQLTNGQILARGPEAFETMVTEATSTLDASKRPTAAGHLHEALQDLSRRPEPDLPGAAYHAMGALECVARDFTDDPKSTLSEILKRHPGLLPAPLDTALSQVWGYASNEAWHVQEGRDISREEAELLVGLSATVSTYLLRKPTS